MTFYVRTRDLAASLKKATELGGKTVLPPTQLPDVELALLADPKGNVIGLVRE